MAGVRTTIRGVLDEGLPEDPYPPELFDRKVDVVFNHIVASYGDDGTSIYGTDEPPSRRAQAQVAVPATVDVDAVTEVVVQRIKTDPEAAVAIAQQLGRLGLER